MGLFEFVTVSLLVFIAILVAGIYRKMSEAREEAAARDRDYREYIRAAADEAERRASGMSPEEWATEKAERRHHEWLARQGGAKK